MNQGLPQQPYPMQDDYDRLAKRAQTARDKATQHRNRVEELRTRLAATDDADIRVMLTAVIAVTEDVAVLNALVAEQSEALAENIRTAGLATPNKSQH